MGLLSEGSPLSWAETKKLGDHVRHHGITQFIKQYHKLENRSYDCLRWGDEVEYMLVRLDPQAKTAKLLLNAHDILINLQEKERTSPKEHPTTWRPEYASYMIEGTPGSPYGHRMAHFNMVEANMKLRREEVLSQLRTSRGETALSLTSFPRLGCDKFTDPEVKPSVQTGSSHSLFFPEAAIYQGHPRFSTLTRNIRERRGERVAINIPIFRDKNTKEPFTEDFGPLGDDGEATRAALPDHVYMDAMGFGMGCSCLQMTFQAVNINEARHLYDQLTPLCPVIMALSAACPIHRGFLVDTDCRWNVISASVDDRTKEERGLEPLKENKFRIPKSRYASIDSYLSPCAEKYNDNDLVYDKDLYQQLRDAGIDHLLAQHIAHLFIRDPISLFSEKVQQDDEQDTDHFENIQSTNWQTMRFKPPPPNSPIGWRVEFRPTEVQLTDFENAAFVVFVVLMTRVILSFHLNFLIPLSKVDENMEAAHKRDAVLTEKFYFRKDIMTCNSPREAEKVCCPKMKADCTMDKEYTLLTINEIINGKPGEFPGLVPLINLYLESVDDCDVDTSCTIQQYLKLIQKRASGELQTTARWMREFVAEHPAYQHDSVVPERVTYDLVGACERVTRGELHIPQLMPQHTSKTKDNLPAAMQKEESYLAAKVTRKITNDTTSTDQHDSSTAASPVAALMNGEAEATAAAAAAAELKCQC